MNCSSCSATLPAGASFCGTCGASAGSGEASFTTLRSRPLAAPEPTAPSFAKEPAAPAKPAYATPAASPEAGTAPTWQQPGAPAAPPWQQPAPSAWQQPAGTWPPAYAPAPAAYAPVPYQPAGVAPYPAPYGYRSPKTKSTAVLLAVFLSYFTWIYTWDRDQSKFWIALGVNVGGFFLSFVLFPLFLLWIPAGFGFWIWSIVSACSRGDDWYARYPNVA